MPRGPRPRSAPVITLALHRLRARVRRVLLSAAPWACLTRYSRLPPGVEPVPFSGPIAAGRHEAAAVNIDNVSADPHRTEPGRELVGRTAEQAVFDQLLANGRAGHGAPLVLSGETGVGKSALPDYAPRQATGYQVIRAQGVASAMDL